MCDAPVAVRDATRSDVGEDEVAVDFVAADLAGCCGEGAVALDELLWEDAGDGFDVVDVLGVVG